MNFDFEISTDDCISKENYFSHFILKQETWKFHENHVFQLLHARLAGKYRWREFPAVITVLGNIPNFAKVGNTGKYEILELFFC